MEVEGAKLTQKQRDKLPNSMFALPEKQALPINDETHVRLAWQMVDRTKGLTEAEKKKARRRILRRAKELGIDTSNWADVSAAMSFEEMGEMVRNALLEKYGKKDSSGLQYGIYIIETYPDHVIYETREGKTYSVDYSIDQDENVTLGTQVEVEHVFIPKREVTASIDLSAKITISEAQHPNRVPFTGTLFVADVPSDRPPGGTNGKKLLVPREVVAASLDTLIGMAVNTNYNLTDHDKRKKIGVIEAAWMEGAEVKVSGILYGKDFPAEVAAIKLQAASGTLGMSLEATNAALEDYEYNGEVVAKALSLTFTGAAILFKDNAAWANTSLAASKKEETNMEEILKAIANLKGELIAHIDETVSKKLEEAKQELKASVDVEKAVGELKASIESLTKDVTDIKAKAEKTPPERKTVTSELLAKFQQDGKNIYDEITASNLPVDKRLELKILALNSGVRQ